MGAKSSGGRLRAEVAHTHRIGADENGLGARLGPLVVTAALARVTEPGHRLISRKPPKRLRSDLGDSKELVSHADFTLGEAWARAIVGKSASTPEELFGRLTLESVPTLQEPCPNHVRKQCWSIENEQFVSDPSTVERLERHLAHWAARGIEVIDIRSSVVCVKRLNTARAIGHTRFTSDLHAMERLVLALRERAGSDVFAVCGKVGGMGDYSRFFGPLSMRLHTVLECGRARSGYYFPGLGEVHFVRDVDSKDQLVMLASMVGKYVRELLMSRVSAFYENGGDDRDAPSGYHDPVTAAFVRATALARKKKKVPDDCFERARDEI
jgi:ribonuclease HII